MYYCVLHVHVDIHVCMYVMYLVSEGEWVNYGGQMQSMCIDQLCTTEGVIQHIWRNKAVHSS